MPGKMSEIFRSRTEQILESPIAPEVKNLYHISKAPFTLARFFSLGKCGRGGVKNPL